MTLNALPQAVNCKASVTKTHAFTRGLTGSPAEMEEIEEEVATEETSTEIEVEIVVEQIVEVTVETVVATGIVEEIKAKEEEREETAVAVAKGSVSDGTLTRNSVVGFLTRLGRLRCGRKTSRWAWSCVLQCPAEPLAWSASVQRFLKSYSALL